MQATMMSPCAIPAGSVRVRLPLAASTNPLIFGTLQAITTCSQYGFVSSPVR